MERIEEPPTRPPDVEDEADTVDDLDIEREYDRESLEGWRFGFKKEVFRDGSWMVVLVAGRWLCILELGDVGRVDSEGLDGIVCVSGESDEIVIVDAPLKVVGSRSVPGSGGTSMPSSCAS